MNPARIFGILLICLALTACDKAPKPHYKMPAKFQPAVNPHPKYFITVKGRIDPALKNVIHLSWISTYQTTNPECRETINRFEGVSDPRHIRSIVRINPNKLGYYKKEIPTDFYKPGFCRWKILNMGYKASSHNKNLNLGPTGFSFLDKAAKTQTAKDVWLCNTMNPKKPSCKLIQAQNISPKLEVNPKSKELTYIINIKRNKK